MPRYPLNALLDAAGRPTHRVVAEVAGVKLATVHKWVQRGLLASRADDLATWFGVDPWAVWPTWFDDTPDDVPCAAEDCTGTFTPGEHSRGQLYCTRACRQRIYSRRRRAKQRAIELLAA